LPHPYIVLTGLWRIHGTWVQFAQCALRDEKMASSPSSNINRHLTEHIFHHV
jgi:hypothetical protein